MSTQTVCDRCGKVAGNKLRRAVIEVRTHTSSRLHDLCGDCNDGLAAFLRDEYTSPAKFKPRNTQAPSKGTP